MVIYLADTHQVVTINVFTNPQTGRPLASDDVGRQPLSTGVPSMVAT